MTETNSLNYVSKDEIISPLYFKADQSATKKRETDGIKRMLTNIDVDKDSLREKYVFEDAYDDYEDDFDEESGSDFDEFEDDEDFDDEQDADEDFDDFDEEDDSKSEDDDFDFEDDDLEYDDFDE